MIDIVGYLKSIQRLPHRPRVHGVLLSQVLIDHPYLDAGSATKQGCVNGSPAGAAATWVRPARR